MESNGYTRKAYHAGSWYQSNPDHLHETLSGYLKKAETEGTINGDSIPRGIIAPHAGFSYSGNTAGHAYNGLRLALEKGWRGTVLVLHPSHHVYLDGCAVSGATSIKTPLGDLLVDQLFRRELLNTGEFSVMNKETDEKEHSGEMQYPFIAKAFFDSTVESSSMLVLPIMIGAISDAQEGHFGRILGKFLAREKVFTVISSDFCHWGKRFGYTPTTPPDHIKAPDSIKEIFEYVSFQVEVQVALNLNLKL
jgi:AmmeMemoRadiSam system protein B